MKKYGIYIIAGVGLLLIFLLIANGKSGRHLDEHITLKQADKIPYGTAAAKKLLPSLFPHASVSFDKGYPTSWDFIDKDSGGQAVLLISNTFNVDEDELDRLFSFVKKGNYVFIVAKTFSSEADEAFHFSYYSPMSNEVLGLPDDSLRIKLEKPTFATDQLFVYPGKKFESYFYNLDTARTRVLGRTERGEPNFIQLNAGKGSVIIHIAPLAFSNYFILHKNNIEYYQEALSVIPESVHKILWNEYYLYKPNDNSNRNNNEPNWLGVLLKYPAFKWGLLTGVSTLIIYVLLSMRRRQRMIPVRTKPRNDSLDFVKTMGRLYYERKDHKNLAIKMSIHFLDHVRTKYRLSTQLVDDDFIQKLHSKSGYPVEALQQIVWFVRDIKSLPAITEGQLSNFYKQVELFYQNT